MNDPLLSTERISWVTPCGRTLVVRRGAPGDIDRLLAFEARLSPGTKYFRFGQFRNFPTSRVYLQTILDPEDGSGAHFLVTLPQTPQEEVIASGRIVIVNSADVCELVIVVRDDWQRSGVGAHLIGTLCREAIARRQAGVYCQVLPTNHGMQAFMKRCDFNQTPNPDSDLLLRFERSLAAPVTKTSQTCHTLVK